MQYQRMDHLPQLSRESWFEWKGQLLMQREWQHDENPPLVCRMDLICSEGIVGVGVRKMELSSGRNSGMWPSMGKYGDYVYSYNITCEINNHSALERQIRNQRNIRAIHTVRTP